MDNDLIQLAAYVVLQIIGIALWVLSALYALMWGIIIRQKAKAEQATEKVFEVHALLLTVSVILIPTLSLSPFHLLWMFPAAILMGMISLIFPFNIILWPFAGLYSSFWYIGVADPGRAYLVAGDYAKAIESFKETIKLKPNSAEAYFNLGLAYRMSGDYKNAIESYKEAIRIKPYFKTYNNLGVAYETSGDYKNAIESYKEAIRIKPDYTLAHYSIALAYSHEGNHDKALEEHNILMKLDKELANKLLDEINAKKI